MDFLRSTFHNYSRSLMYKVYIGILLYPRYLFIYFVNKIERRLLIRVRARCNWENCKKKKRKLIKKKKKPLYIFIMESDLYAIFGDFNYR